MLFLRQSTASQEILLGPFVDSTDGNTAETGLTIANTDIKLWLEGGTTLTNKNSGGATHISDGYYYAVLDATDTGTVGKLEVNVKVAGALAVRREYHVLEEAVYDALFAASAAGAPSAATIADAVWDEIITPHISITDSTAEYLSTMSAGITTLATRITSTLFTGITSLAEWLGLLAGKQTGNSTARNEIRATGVGSGTFTETTDSMEALRDKESDIESDTQDIQSRLPAALTAGGNIKADALAISGDTAAADNAEAFFDGTGYGVHIGTGTIQTVTSSTIIEISGIPAGDFADTLNGCVAVIYKFDLAHLCVRTITDSADAGGNVTITLDSAASFTMEANDIVRVFPATALAAINAQVVDAIATDTYGEPAQGAPAVTTSLAAKINWLYKALRNKKTQTASQFSLYADDNTTVDTKATVSDDGTTTTVGKLASGP